MRRVAVVSGPGAGKTSLARALGLPHVELDALWWGPGWSQVPPAVFEQRVRDASSGEAWVIEGFYVDEAGVPIVWPRADTLVWLDLPRRVCVPRAVRRTFRQIVSRAELWNRNRQRASALTPRSIWRLWRTWPNYPATIERALAGQDWSHLDVVRLRDTSDIRQFLAGRSADGLPH